MATAQLPPLTLGPTSHSRPVSNSSARRFNLNHNFRSSTPREDKSRSSFFITQRTPTATPSSARSVSVTNPPKPIPVPPVLRLTTPSLPALRLVDSRATNDPPMLSPRRIAGDGIVEEDTPFVSDQVRQFEKQHLRSRSASVSSDSSDDVPLQPTKPKGAGESHEKIQFNPSDAHQQELFRTLFQHKLTVQTHLARNLLTRDPDELRKELILYINRFGMRQMGVEEFYLVLMDILEMDEMSFTDARVLFELFDTNRSGILDVDELMEGLRLLLLDEEAMKLLYCRKIFIENRFHRDSMLSYSEVEMLLYTLARYVQDPEVDEEIPRVLNDIWKHGHQGQITVPLLRTYVMNNRVLKPRVHEINPDVKPHQRMPPKPTPEEVLLYMAAHPSPLKAMAFQPSGPGGVTIQAPSSDGKPSDSRGGAMGDTTEGDMTDAEGVSGQTTEEANARATQRDRAPLLAEVMDSHHPKFRADLAMQEDKAKQLAAWELHNPQWYTVRGQVWRKNDVTAAEPVFDE